MLVDNLNNTFLFLWQSPKHKCSRQVLIDPNTMIIVTNQTADNNLKRSEGFL